AAGARQPASGPVPEAVARHSSVHGLPDHSDCGPQRPGERQDTRTDGAVVGARNISADWSGVGVLGAVALEDGESPQCVGGGSW
nr:hypothetical protein [Tanacetum cinerariifolium]